MESIDTFSPKWEWLPDTETYDQCGTLVGDFALVASENRQKIRQKRPETDMKLRFR